MSPSNHDRPGDTEHENQLNHSKHAQYASKSRFATICTIFSITFLGTLGVWFWSEHQPTTHPADLAPTASGQHIIDLMVVYNDAADELYEGDALTRINHLIDVSNQIYNDSGVALSLRLVHTQKVTYEAGFDSPTAIKQFTNASHPAFSDVSELRATHGADLVVLMRPHADDGFCGLAWVGGKGTDGDFSHPEEKDYGYSHVSLDCGTHVLAHELGHNMGLNHSRKQDGDGGTFEFALGHGVDNDFVTVMAYESSFNADKVKLFSSPSLSCGGEPCGVDRASDSGADAVFTLNHVGPQIAGYFESTSTAVSTWESGPLDVDGNGTADIVLQHRSGDWSLGTMSGAEVTGLHDLELTSDPAWNVVGRQDYDGDGMADILLRHSSSGEWRTFLLDGMQVKSQGSPTLTGNLDWQAVGTGDFDGDGKGDVLLRKDDGRWYLYFLDGIEVGSTARPALPRDEGLSLAGTGDFNGDGKTDILTRASDGGWHLYHMNGADISASQPIPMKKSLDWQVAGVGDFNGNEQDDLLLRYKNGDWLVYQFEEFSVNTPNFLPMTSDLDWQLASTGDFDGDGDSDILIRSNVFGTWRLYKLDQNQVETNTEVALTSDLDWDITRGG